MIQPQCRRLRLSRSLAVATVLGATVVGFLGGATTARAATTKLPFSDPSINGYIGLCDLAGNNVTSGSITSKPFVWLAVSSWTPPKTYTGKGEQAGLFIYQPRPDTPAVDWSGDEMTASTVYRSPKFPAAAATYKDFSMANYIREFPSQVNGLYELRMHFGLANYGTYSETYPATFIQVTGNRWHVVQGGTVACKSAHATSTEATVGIPQVDPSHDPNQTPVTAPPSTQPSAKSSSASNGSQSPHTSSSGGGGPGETISEPIAGAQTAASKTATNPLVVILAVACGLLLVTIIIGFIRRRQQDRRAT